MLNTPLRDLILQVVDEMKGIDVLTITLNEIADFADFMIICTGRSTRHIKSIADQALIKIKASHLVLPHIEGNNDSDWVLVDAGDVILHVMLKDAREFYDLESLWQTSTARNITK